MKREFYTLELVNIVAYFNQMGQEKLSALPTKMRWYIKKNLGKIAPTVKQFEDFRTELVTELQQKWFDDEHSEEVVQTKIQDGQPVLDENGSEVTETVRKVKDEYLDEYSKAVSDVNERLKEILTERVEIKIDPIDVDGFVETMSDDCPITFEDLDILSAFVPTFREA